MADVRINLDANAAAQNLTNLTTQVERLVQVLRQAGQAGQELGSTLGGGPAETILPRAGGFREWSQRVGRPAPSGQLQPSEQTGLLRALGYEATPGGGITRIGRTPTLLPPGGRVEAGPVDVRPGGVRPWPAGIPPSPFGPGLGGPPSAGPLGAGAPGTPARVSPWPSGAGGTSRPLTQAQMNQGVAALFGFGPGIPGAQGPQVVAQAVANVAGLIGNQAAIFGPTQTLPLSVRAPLSRPQTHAQLAAGMANFYGTPLTPFAGTLAQGAMGLVGNPAMFGPPGPSPYYGGGMMPPPQGPYSAWPATAGQRAMGYAGGFGQQAFAGAGGQFMGGLGAIAGGAAGIAGRVGGLALGFTAYQLLSQGLQTFEARSRGVLAVGSMLDGQYKEIDTTLRGLRESYQVLGQEAVGAMMALGRTTTSMAGLGRNIRVGRAYGVAPEAIGGFQGALGALGSTAVPDLGILAGIRQEAAARGQRVLPVEPFLEQAVRMAGVGGVGAPPMPEAFYGRMQTFMGEIGGTRMGLNPAEAFGQFAGGLAQPSTDIGQVMRQRAISRLAQRTPILNLNGMELNIAGNWQDRQIAMEQAAFLPEVQQAYTEEGGRLSGRNPAMQAFWQQQLFGTQTAYQARIQGERMGASAGQPGGIPGYFEAPVDMVRARAEETTRIEDQQADEAAREGYKLRLRDAQKQMEGELELIKQLDNVGTSVVNALAKSAKAYEENEGVIRSFNTFFREMSPELMSGIAAAAVALAPFTGGTTLGVALGIGAVGGFGAFVSERERAAATLNRAATQPSRPTP